MGGIATIGLRHAGDTPTEIFYGCNSPQSRRHGSGCVGEAAGGASVRGVCRWRLGRAVWARRQVALVSCWAARDELTVRVVADHERVFADDLEAVARVETLRPVILAPHADPQGARPLALEPLQRCA